MTRHCLPLARLCSAMWVGAALLFVATSVTEQVHPSLDGDTKAMLALIRFPWYYGTGAVLLSIATAASLAAAARRKVVIAAGCSLAVALLVMATDYLWIYRPLRALLLPQGGGRGAEFERLHAWSEWSNSAGLLFTAIAAVILCGTRGPTASESQR